MTLEHPPHRGLGVAHTPPGLGDLDNARDGPEVGREPVGQRTLGKNRGEGDLVRPWHPRRSARSRGGTEGLWPSSIESFLPVAHRYGSDSEVARDLGLREAGAEQGEALQATFLQSGRITSALGPASHARGENTSRIITYLRKSQ